MKPGESLATTTPFAERAIGERGHRVQHGAVRVRRRDHFEQVQIARRVEEVRAEPVTTEVVAAALGDRGDRNGRRVRADDAARASGGIDARHQLALHVELLDDGLEDPVGVLQARQTVVEAGGGDELVRVRREEGIGLQPARPLEALLGRFRGDVEQQCRHASVGEVGGDLGAHDARAQHRDRS